MKAAYTPKLNKRDIADYYVQLRNEAFKECAIDMTKQTCCIMLEALRISGKYTDDELRDMYEEFVRWINTDKIMGKPMRSDQVTDHIVQQLGIDLERINPRIGD